MAVVVVKDEAARFPFLLQYYRKLGVDHFLVIDNRSIDNVQDLLHQEPDVSIFKSDADFKCARFGIDWVNGILRKLCVGKWVLWIDADELLIFSGREAATLAELTKKLEELGHDSLQTVMIDMYSDRPPEQNIVPPGVSPLEICDLYDRSGYLRRRDQETRTSWIKGGVRGRIFFPDRSEGPALNKTPLVKWRRHYLFMKVAHELWPRRLNESGQVGGALLHFKFTSTSVQKMTDPAVRRQHTEEYEAYTRVHDRTFTSEITGRFTGGESLIADGLFCPYV